MYIADKRKGGAVLKVILFITVVILITMVLLGTLAGILITRTPRQLGLQNVAIGNKTVDSMGIADTRFIDMAKSFKNATNVDEKTIVTNGYSANVEKGASSTNFNNSTLKNTDNYGSIVVTPVVYDNQYFITCKDTTLGYIINNAAQFCSENNSSVAFMQKAKIALVETTITKQEEKGNLRSVCKMDVSEFTNQIKSNMGVLSSILTVPEYIYLVSEIEFTIDSVGKMVTTSKSIAINSTDSDIVINAIVDLILENIDGLNSLDDINSKLGEVYSDIIYNLGGIGTADANSDLEVTGNIAYGICGVDNGQVSFITHTA